MATRSNSEEQKRTYSPEGERRLIKLISTEAPHNSVGGKRNSRSVDQHGEVFVEKYAPTHEDEYIDEIETSLHSLNRKLYSISNNLTERNLHFERALHSSGQYVVEEKGVAFRAGRLATADTAQY